MPNSFAISSIGTPLNLAINTVRCRSVSAASPWASAAAFAHAHGSAWPSPSSTWFGATERLKSLSVSRFRCWSQPLRASLRAVLREMPKNQAGSDPWFGSNWSRCSQAQASASWSTSSISSGRSSPANCRRRIARVRGPNFRTISTSAFGSPRIKRRTSSSNDTTPSPAKEKPLACRLVYRPTGWASNFRGRRPDALAAHRTACPLDACAAGVSGPSNRSHPRDAHFALSFALRRGRQDRQVHRLDCRLRAFHGALGRVSRAPPPTKKTS